MEQSYGFPSNFDSPSFQIFQNQNEKNGYWKAGWKQGATSKPVYPLWLKVWRCLHETDRRHLQSYEMGHFEERRHNIVNGVKKHPPPTQNYKELRSENRRESLAAESFEVC